MWTASISASTASSRTERGIANAAQFSSSCSSVDAPMITEPLLSTNSRVLHHRMASWAGVMPTRSAMAAYLSTARRVASLAEPGADVHCRGRNAKDREEAKGALCRRRWGLAPLL